jgi:hypothetical protein
MPSQSDLVMQKQLPANCYNSLQIKKTYPGMMLQVDHRLLTKPPHKRMQNFTSLAL